MVQRLVRHWYSNRFPTALGDATLRLSPLVVAKMVLVIDYSTDTPTQITEVLLCGEKWCWGSRCCTGLCCKKKLKVRKPLGKSWLCNYSKDLVHALNRMVNGSNSLLSFPIFIFLSFERSPCRFKRAEFHLRTFISLWFGLTMLLRYLFCEFNFFCLFMLFIIALGNLTQPARSCSVKLQFIN